MIAQAAKLCGTAAKYGWVHDSLCGCDRRTDAKCQHKIKFQKGSSAGPKLEYNILSEAEVFRMEQRAAKAVEIFVEMIRGCPRFCVVEFGG